MISKSLPSLNRSPALSAASFLLERKVHNSEHVLAGVLRYENAIELFCVDHFVTLRLECKGDKTRAQNADDPFTELRTVWVHVLQGIHIGIQHAGPSKSSPSDKEADKVWPASPSNREADKVWPDGSRTKILSQP